MNKIDAINEGLWELDSRHQSGLTWAETSWEMDQESTHAESEYLVHDVVRDWCLGVVNKVTKSCTLTLT